VQVRGTEDYLGDEGGCVWGRVSFWKHAYMFMLATAGTPKVAPLMDGPSFKDLLV